MTTGSPDRFLERRRFTVDGIKKSFPVSSELSHGMLLGAFLAGLGYISPDLAGYLLAQKIRLSPPAERPGITSRAETAAGTGFEVRTLATGKSVSDGSRGSRERSVQLPAPSVENIERRLADVQFWRFLVENPSYGFGLAPVVNPALSPEDSKTAIGEVIKIVNRGELLAYYTDIQNKRVIPIAQISETPITASGSRLYLVTDSNGGKSYVDPRWVWIQGDKTVIHDGWLNLTTPQEMRDFITHKVAFGNFLSTTKGPFEYNNPDGFRWDDEKRQQALVELTMDFEGQLDNGQSWRNIQDRLGNLTVVLSTVGGHMNSADQNRALITIVVSPDGSVDYPALSHEIEHFFQRFVSDSQRKDIYLSEFMAQGRYHRTHPEIPNLMPVTPPRYCPPSITNEFYDYGWYSLKQLEVKYPQLERKIQEAYTSKYGSSRTPSMTLSELLSALKLVYPGTEIASDLGGYPFSCIVQ